MRPQAQIQTPQMTDLCLKFLNVGTGIAVRRIAVRAREGAAPGLFWLGGFKSDMKGTKAEALDLWARDHGRAMTRFDYSGHGESEGDFIDGTVGRWLEEGMAVFDACCRGPQVVIGSSMGGWLALLLARELARRAQADPSLASLVLIAPAVDFTEELMWKRFPPEVKREIEQTGVWARPSQYSDQPYLITRGLIEEGRSHLLLDEHDRNRLSGPHPSGRAGSRRAVAARGRAELPVCPGRRGAHVGQGRRPPPVAPRGYRAAHRGGRRVLGRGQNGFSHPDQAA